MKFLCVPCDQPMKLQTVHSPDRGSLSVVYGCPTCGYEMAMLTNPFETQLVSSLGVKIGPGASTEATSTASAEGPRCPFSGIVSGMGDGEAEIGDEIPWTPGARERLGIIPEFVRPMAKSGIEKFAKDSGYAQVDERVLDEAKTRFAM